MQVLDVLENIFHVKKPIIGVVHLSPMPGTPLYRGDFEKIYKNALGDAEAYYSAGIDGIIIENYGDKPYSVRVRDTAVLAGFTIIAYDMKRKYKIPLGINILRNSGVEALSIAYVVGAEFIRVNNLCQVLASPEGIIHPIAKEIAEVKAKLNASVKVFADINVKHATPLSSHIEIVAKDHVERCLADALIITGPRTGLEVNIVDLKEAKEAINKPVLVGSSITLSNINKFWNYADGFIIGTYFKEKGIIENRVAYQKVYGFVKHVNKLRGIG